jgi:hypothetical protein
MFIQGVIRILYIFDIEFGNQIKITFLRAIYRFEDEEEEKANVIGYVLKKMYSIRPPSADKINLHLFSKFKKVDFNISFGTFFISLSIFSFRSSNVFGNGL